MSKCPGNDIHSLYIDNELPTTYKIEYETHLVSCEHCRNQFQRYQAMRNQLSALEDLNELTGNYERLKTELRFRTNSAKGSVNQTMLFVRKFSPILVAAAVVAVFLPVISFMTKTTGTQNNFNPIYASNDSLINDLALQVSLLSQNQMKLKETLNNRGMVKNGNYYTASLTNSTIDYEAVFNSNQDKKSIPVDILRNVTPSTVISSVDSFGLERPVFLLQD